MPGDWMDPALLVEAELAQRREEGCDTAALEGEFEALKACNPLNQGLLLGVLLSRAGELKPPEEAGWDEPSRLDEIRMLRPTGPRRLPLSLSDGELADKLFGAWLGRSAGCLLGKPVEGWDRERIESYLKLAGEFPLADYFPALDPLPEGFTPHRSFDESTRGHIACMPRDDDMDYPILNLHLVEDNGLGFTTENVAEQWLTHLPYMMVYTAERAAYHNLVNGIVPPATAVVNNPYREWIGAQIRADLFGWISPAWPERAATLAFRDAALSHVKNGIYGEMFVAAALAAAFVTNNVHEVIQVGLSEIPAKCRFREMADDVLGWSRECVTWEEAWNKVMAKYGHYHRVHTINNAAFVFLGLLYGKGDFGRTVSIAVQSGFDTDCNGATAGSILGVMHGAHALPRKWTEPLRNRIKSIVVEFTDCRLSDLADRTLAQARANLGR